MLVLSRRMNETVILTTANGETIVVTVVGVRGKHVKLGLGADKSVRITRPDAQRKEPKE